MIEAKHLDLLQFEKIRSLVKENCFGELASGLCDDIYPQSSVEHVLPELERVRELSGIIAAGGFLPSLEYTDIRRDLTYLQREGSQLQEDQLLALQKTFENVNSLIRFLKGRKADLPRFFEISDELQVHPQVVEAISMVLDSEGQVKDRASPDLQRIRKDIREQRRESDKRFYHHIAQLRKDGFLRENEESFFNGRRTLAVPVEHKSEVPGFVHGKSESGKTIFIEPGQTMGINNEIAELLIDERRELNRILRELCSQIRPYVTDMRQAFEFMVYADFVRAKARLAVALNASLPTIKKDFSMNLQMARHPILFLQNKKTGKPTIPLSMSLNDEERILVISGPNAGGKTIALKTVGLLQIMLQSGLLIPASEASEVSFFEEILIDMGDTQSIENELSTYSAKLKTMTRILEKVNQATLVLMDEFGSGTDPELGSAVAEAVLESLVKSKTRGIITSHFGNVKLLADTLQGSFNGSMLFDIEHLEPLYQLSVGEPGSSYTFEVAEKVGFPIHIIERAREKVDRDKLKLNRLLAEVQSQKTRLSEEQERLEHEVFLGKIAKEKYMELFLQWEQRIQKERERKIEMARQAEFGIKYLRFLEDWNQKKDRKDIIKRFIDGITAETKKQEALRKQNKLDSFSQKKIERLKGALRIGSKVRVLNGQEIGIVEEIKDEKVLVRFGLHKMTVGMQNVMLAEEK